MDHLKPQLDFDLSEVSQKTYQEILRNFDISGVYHFTTINSFKKIIESGGHLKKRSQLNPEDIAFKSEGGIGDFIYMALFSDHTPLPKSKNRVYLKFKPGLLDSVSQFMFSPSIWTHGNYNNSVISSSDKARTTIGFLSRGPSNEIMLNKKVELQHWLESIIVDEKQKPELIRTIRESQLSQKLGVPIEELIQTSQERRQKSCGETLETKSKKTKAS